MPKTKGTRAMNGQKKCSRCLATKHVDEFNKSKSHRDGYDPQCKACKAEHSERKSAPGATI